METFLWGVLLAVTAAACLPLTLWLSLRKGDHVHHWRRPPAEVELLERPPGEGAGERPKPPAQRVA